MIPTKSNSKSPSSFTAGIPDLKIVIDGGKMDFSVRPTSLIARDSVDAAKRLRRRVRRWAWV